MEISQQQSSRRLSTELGECQFTLAEMLDLEREHLMSMPEPFNEYVENPARVSTTFLVNVARNKYSVPCEWAGQMVSTRLYPDRVDVVAKDAIVASHTRLTNRAQMSYDWQHYIDLVQRKPGALRNGTPFMDLPPALLKLRQSLMRHIGGDWVMAQVLAVVQHRGWTLYWWRWRSYWKEPPTVASVWSMCTMCWRA